MQALQVLKLDKKEGETDKFLRYVGSVEKTVEEWEDVKEGKLTASLRWDGVAGPKKAKKFGW